MQRWNWILLTLAVSTTVPAISQSGFAKVSPFDGLRWSEGLPQVRIDATWYRLVSLNGIATKDLIAFCNKQYGELARKRFREDLVQVLSEMKQPPKSMKARLQLTHADTGKRVQRTVTMTPGRRRALRDQFLRGNELPRRGRQVPNRPKRGFRRDRFPKLSPFDGLRFVDDSAEVKLEGAWYELLTFDGIAAGKILDHCKKTYGGQWKKRFGEDLVEVLAGMGHRAGRTSKLRVRAADGKTREFADVAMTSAKRNAIRDSSSPKGRPAALAPRVLTREQALADLRQLGELVRSRYSYRDMRNVDIDALLAATRTKIDGALSGKEFARHVMRFLAQFGDGHTRVQGSSLYLQSGATPFAIVPHGNRVVAMAPDGRSLLDPRHPYLTEIDGVGIQTWLDAASSIVADGSPQFRLEDAARRLQSIQFARAELGRTPTTELSVQLSSTDGKSSEVRRLAVASRRPRGRRYEPLGHRVLEGRVGYLRIPSMLGGPQFAEWLERAMQALRETRGLIIDVRGNGGGSRDALRTLLPYFLPQNEPARVVNVAAARVDTGTRTPPQGLLSNRYLYPKHWPDWSKEARSAIDAIERSFRPDWKLPKGDFSDWHYMVIERGGAAFHYGKPVRILIDGGCFSATDIFVAGFKGVADVKLVGEPTGGGSGRSRSFLLENSQVSFRLSSMASFTRDGQRYDGKGIAPDVVLRPTLDDLTGATDSVLARVTQLLR